VRLRGQLARHQVRVRLAAPADEVEALMGRWGSVEPIADEECRMTLNTDSLTGR
jgi:hypothetical protein